MPAQIFSSQDNETQILITVQHGQSMLKFEEHLQDELNSAGRLAAAQQLRHLDINGEPIVKGAIRLTSKKKKEPKVYETPWGALRKGSFHVTYPQSVGLFIRSLGVFLEENESTRLSYCS